MSRFITIILIFAGFAGVAVADPPVEVRPPRTDSYGDPLPKGAIARLGTIRWKGHEKMSALAFSPDGKRVAAACGEDRLQIWDFPSGLPLRQYPLPNAYQVQQVVFAVDRNAIVLNGTNGELVRILDLDSGKIQPLVQQAVSPDRKMHSVISQNGKWALVHVEHQDHEERRHHLSLIEVAKPKQPRHLGTVIIKNPKPIGDAECPVALSPDGGWAALGIRDEDDKGRVYLFDSVGERTWTSPAIEAERSFRLSFSPDYRSLVVGTGERLFRWEIEASDAKSPNVRSACHFDAKGCPGNPDRFCFTPDGKFLLCSTDFGTVCLFDARSGKRLRFLQLGPTEKRMAVSPDGSILAVATVNEVGLRFFEIDTGRELSTPSGHPGAVTDLAFLPSGKGLASYCATDGSIRTWALTPKRVPISISAKKSIVEDRILSREFARIQSQIGSHYVVFADEGRLLFSVNNGNIWVMETDKRPPRCYFIHSNNIAWRSMAVSPDGSTLALALSDSGLQLIDTKTGKPCPNQPNLDEMVKGMFFNPDGKTIGATTDSGFHLFDSKTGQNRKPAFVPDKGIATRFFASRHDSDLTVQIWNRSTGKLARQIEEIEGEFALAPDGRYLASAQGSGFAVHEVATGQIVLQGNNGNERVTSLRYSPDATLLAVGYSNGTILLWDLRTPLKKLAQPLQSAELWNDLASDSAEKAYAAIGALASSPKEALALLKDKLKPAEPIAPQVMAQLLADLNHSQYAVREKATRQLEKMIHQIGTELEKAFVQAEPEVRWRIERVLKSARQPLVGGDGLRSIRCVEILERIGSVEARELLEKLARGAGISAREARDSLERLRGR